jgi:hypothetical protein
VGPSGRSWCHSGKALKGDVGPGVCQLLSAPWLKIQTLTQAHADAVIWGPGQRPKPMGPPRLGQGPPELQTTNLLFIRIPDTSQKQVISILISC